MAKHPQQLLKIAISTNLRLQIIQVHYFLYDGDSSSSRPFCAVLVLVEKAFGS